MTHENNNTPPLNNLLDTRDLLQRLAEAGLPSAPVHTAHDAKNSQELSLWVKAASQTGHRFCMRVHHPADLPLALSKAKKLDEAANPIIQTAIEGNTYALLGRPTSGHFQVLTQTQVEMTEGMFRIPIAYTAPPDLDPACEVALSQAATALNELPHTDDTILAAEVVLTERGAILTDLHAMPVLCPILLHALDTTLGIGWRTALLPQEKGMALRWLPSPSGRVTAIEGIETARAIDGVCRVVINTHPGDILLHATDTKSRNRAGYVIATGQNASEAYRTAQRAVETIHIETQITQD